MEGKDANNSGKSKNDLEDCKVVLLDLRKWKFPAYIREHTIVITKNLNGQNDKPEKFQILKPVDLIMCAENQYETETNVMETSYETTHRKCSIYENSTEVVNMQNGTQKLLRKSRKSAEEDNNEQILTNFEELGAGQRSRKNKSAARTIKKNFGRPICNQESINEMERSNKTTRKKPYTQKNSRKIVNVKKKGAKTPVQKSSWESSEEDNNERILTWNTVAGTLKETSGNQESINTSSKSNRRHKKKIINSCSTSVCSHKRKLSAVKNMVNKIQKCLKSL